MSEKCNILAVLMGESFFLVRQHIMNCVKLCMTTSPITIGRYYDPDHVIIYREVYCLQI